MTDIAAVVAAAANSRGIGYKGQLVRLPHSSLGVLHVWTKCCTQGLDQLTHTTARAQPWRLPGDMAHFKRVTTEAPSPETINAVIMGRKTWDSIPSKFRPLEGRTNVVLTRSATREYPEGVMVASSLQDAIQQLEQAEHLGHVFIIGGAQVYEEAIQCGLVNKVIYTEIDHIPLDNCKFDAFFPTLAKGDWTCQDFRTGDKENTPHKQNDDQIHIDTVSGLTFKFLEYTRIPKPAEGAHINPEEMQYLELCRDIIENGVSLRDGACTLVLLFIKTLLCFIIIVFNPTSNSFRQIKRGDRTGTGTLSKFGTQMRFSLRDGTLPLLTTKRVFWRGVAEELLWFISGNTNGNDLANKDIHIWDGNGSREFLDQRGLGHREVGDLGPVYGFQWRHFGAKYVDMHTDYNGKGVDQLAECIDKIKNNPEDRRIILSAWNPADLNEMALPPCHMFCQFYVDTERGELSCQMYQRSADMGLGVPFNIASYALLTHMMAQACGLKPGEFVHTLGDAHVYSNHVEALKEQLTRLPRAFPKIKINPDRKSIDDFVFEDFEVIGYNPQKSIKMTMAV